MPTIRKKKSMEEIIASQRSNMSPEEQLGTPEEGLEEEATPIEMAKPFKKAAIENAGMEDSFAGNALDMAIPDSPLALAGKASRGIKGIGKFMNAMPSAKQQQESAAALKASREFGKNAANTRSSEGTIGYHKPGAIERQISDETATTQPAYWKQSPSSSGSSQKWKEKERAAGRPIYAEMRSKGKIVKKQEEEAP